MATLYVENVPDDLYEALRERARGNRRSIAAEVLTLLEHYVPTPKELQRRRQWIRQVKRLRPLKSTSAGPFPSTEEMLREDRNR